MAFCRECGARLSEGAKFCIECGTPVARPEAAGKIAAVANTARQVVEAVAGAIDAPDTPGEFVVGTWSSDPSSALAGAASAVGATSSAVGATAIWLREHGSKEDGVDYGPVPEDEYEDEFEEEAEPDVPAPTFVAAPTQRTCPHCGSPVGADARFCRTCGEDLSAPTQRTCPHCGSVVGDEARFCRTCGNPLS